MISSQLQGIITKSGTTPCRIPIQIELQYDDADPLAFSLVFHAPGERPKPWVASRALLVEAMESDEIVGEGNMRFQKDVFLQKLGACVQNEAGHIHVALPLQRVADFLEQSEDEAAEADSPETMGDLVDEAIRVILGGR